MEEPIFIHQSEMDSFDSFTTQEIVAALEEDSQPSFTSESFSFYPRSNMTTATFSCSSMLASQTSYEIPTKQLKSTDSRNSFTTSRKGSYPSILSFGNPNRTTNHQQFYEYVVGAVEPKEKAVSDGNMTFASDIRISQSSHIKKNKGNTKVSTVATMYPSCAQDHLIAERKRREKLAQSIIALSAIIPGLKKIDKVSILRDAAKYLKQLQERVKALEEQTTKKSMESVLLAKKPQLFANDDISSSKKHFIDVKDGSLPEIKARIFDKNVLIKIHCEKNKGDLVKILAKIEKFNLTIVNSSALPFRNSAIDITIIAQMDVGFCMTVKDLMKNLQSAFRQFM